MMANSLEKRLEQYTIKRPQEVLLVEVESEGEKDFLIIFKGFSSSLMRPTAPDPDIPLLPESTKIISIDRATSPYNPDVPCYLQRGLNWEAMEGLLREVGV